MGTADYRTSTNNWIAAAMSMANNKMAIAIVVPGLMSVHLIV